MSKIRALINFVRDNDIAVQGKFVEIDVAPIEDELTYLSHPVDILLDLAAKRGMVVTKETEEYLRSICDKEVIIDFNLGGSK